MGKGQVKPKLERQWVKIWKNRRGRVGMKEHTIYVHTVRFPCNDHSRGQWCCFPHIMDSLKSKFLPINIMWSQHKLSIMVFMILCLSTLQFCYKKYCTFPCWLASTLDHCSFWLCLFISPLAHSIIVLKPLKTDAPTVWAQTTGFFRALLLYMWMCWFPGLFEANKYHSLITALNKYNL